MHPFRWRKPGQGAETEVNVVRIRLAIRARPRLFEKHLRQRYSVVATVNDIRFPIKFDGSSRDAILTSEHARKAPTERIGFGGVLGTRPLSDYILLESGIPCGAFSTRISILRIDLFR